MENEEQDPLAPMGSSRRAFVKKMVAAGFAAPMIGTFGFAELASAACPPHHSYPNQTPPPQPPPPQHGNPLGALEALLEDVGSFFKHNKH